MKISKENLRGAIRLVPNQAILDLALGEHCLRETVCASVFIRPAIEVLSRWAAQLAQRSCLLQGQHASTVPPKLMIRSLWEAEISRDSTRQPAECRAMALQAMEAERLAWHWAQGNIDWPGGPAWGDFKCWRRPVHKALEAHSWHTAEQAMAWLIRDMEEGRLAGSLLPRAIVLDGFVELTELESRLFALLEESSVLVSYQQPPPPESKLDKRESFPSLEEEFAAAASWAHGQRENGCRRAAVIVNELDAHEDRLRRLFQDRFNPEAVLGFTDSGDCGYHLRGGPPLIRHPLVSNALDLLELSLGGPRRKHHFSVLSRSLLSPGWAGAGTERFARALLEHRMRERGSFRWSLAQLSQMADVAETPMLVEIIARLPGEGVGQEPAHQFLALLQHWGWPGPLARDSIAEQAVGAFASALEELPGAGLKHVHAALAFLREMCRERSQSRPGGALSPIQLIRPEDAVGRQFECARLVNFNAGNWPPPVRRNPLLPASLICRIPVAAYPGQFEYARGLTRSLLACATEVVCTWSESLQGVPQSPSSLLDGGAHASLASRNYSLAHKANPALGKLNGEGTHPWLRAKLVRTGLALDAGEKHLRRAVDLVSLQSACPFAAYLVHRLAARFQEPPRPFATAAYTGMLVHKALERLYRPHTGKSALPPVAEVPAAVDAALEMCDAEWRLPPVALEAERLRLVDLLEEWLATEALRNTGVPKKLEEAVQAQLHGFEFELRIDRVDRMADGRSFVLDYKTGSLDSLHWADERLTEPQLPLYAVVLGSDGDGAAGGVALASVRPGEMKLRGLSDDSGLAGHGIDGFEKRGYLSRQFASWDAALVHWDNALKMVLEEYRAGDCSHLVHHAAPLRYAGLEPLVRPDLLQAWASPEAGHE